MTGRGRIEKEILEEISSVALRSPACFLFFLALLFVRYLFSFVLAFLFVIDDLYQHHDQLQGQDSWETQLQSQDR
jgi:hypothetical protein